MLEEKMAFRSAMQQVRSGSPDAVWRFIEDYGPHLHRIVRRRLDRRMRSKFDSLDFVQMVWASFFCNPITLRSFDSSEDLVRYLAAMARRKVVTEYRRRLRTDKHDVRREQPLSEACNEPSGSTRLTPSQVAMAREEWNRLMETENKRDRSILELRFAGASYVEISQQLGINEKTARQVIARLIRPSEVAH